MFYSRVLYLLQCLQIFIEQTEFFGKQENVYESMNVFNYLIVE